MAVSNKLANRNSNNKPQTFSSYLTGDLVRKKINEMVGGRDGQRFITSIISAVSVNPALSECEYGTILSAAMLGESLKLSPSPQLGQYYMVPFNDKKRGCLLYTSFHGVKVYNPNLLIRIVIIIDEPCSVFIKTTFIDSIIYFFCASFSVSSIYN